MSVVYHLFTVWFLIFYHYNNTLDHPEHRSELLWIIQSISLNLWMVQSDNLGDLFFLFSSFCLQLIAMQIIYYSHLNLLLPQWHSLRSTLDDPKYFLFLGFEDGYTTSTYISQYFSLILLKHCLFFSFFRTQNHLLFASQSLDDTQKYFGSRFWSIL